MTYSQDKWDADEARYKAERDEMPEPEEEPVWEFYSGPFVCLESAIGAVRYLNAAFKHLKFGVWPDPNTTTKWIIKRTWR